MLRFMGSQRAGHNLATEQQQYNLLVSYLLHEILKFQLLFLPLSSGPTIPIMRKKQRARIKHLNKITVDFCKYHK